MAAFARKMGTPETMRRRGLHACMTVLYLAFPLISPLISQHRAFAASQQIDQVRHVEIESTSTSSYTMDSVCLMACDSFSIACDVS